jgi:anhydro-N-acetylmuramic acid kinase
LNNLDFYNINSAKYLGREWFENEFLPIVASSTVKLEDKLCTCVAHIAQQIALSIQENQLAGKMLITGGGAFNNFLIERIQARTTIKTIIPDTQTIAFKEALIFAFLGLLKFQNKINVLGSSTGSKNDHVGGCIYSKGQS